MAGKRKDYMSTHVHCPNWQCGGELFFVQNKNEPDGWQCPDIECDNCHTRWKNMLNEANKKEQEKK